MPAGVVCLIERVGAGTVIGRVRLIGPGLVREWTAPAAGEPGGPGQGEGDGLAQARLAAAWILETLAGAGLRRLAGVCIDPDGAVCSWLSLADVQPALVEAAISQAALDTEGSGPGVAAARVLSAPAGEDAGTMLALTTSVQALAEPAAFERPARGTKKVEITPGKHRFAVLSLPDAPVRVVLDELDRKGIEVDRVLSLWHAMALAWDPGAQDRREDSPLESSAGTSAVVLVEPSGRLNWAWARDGELLAAGVLKLRAIPRVSAEGALATTDDEGASRRAGETRSAALLPMIEFTSADAGRLALDWLSWSAQLGVSPRRIVCVPSETVSDAAGTGPAALARGLARAWPGATVDGAAVADPLGATIGRIAGVAGEPSGQGAGEGVLVSSAPRLALTGLSTRAGRVDRARYRWIAAAIAGSAVLVGVIGWRISASASGALDVARQLDQRRKDALVELEPVIPNLSREPNPAERLDARLKELQGQAKAMRPARPLLQEAITFLKALREASPPPGPGPGENDLAMAEGIKLLDFEMNQLVATARLSVPDAETGPRVLSALRKANTVLPWQGTVPGGQPAGQRTYSLSAIWNDAPAAGSGSGAGGGRP